MPRNCFLALLAFASLALLHPLEQARAADWPMWRADARRSASTDQELAPELHLEWVRHLPALETAWPDQPKMQFDRNYEPVVLGQTLFVGSSRIDSLTAIDTRTGVLKWTFSTDGPIRFAPLAWQGKVYVVSDDGYLYCVDAEDGTLLWRFRGGPEERKVLGNKRLISAWPARGAPVLVDGTVYFAASIWPFMGVFIHALDAETGEVVWTNDGDGSMYIKQPHNTDSFAGIAPQGPFVVEGHRLLIPGGRSVPACYDRHTGKMLHYRLAANAKRGGGSAVASLGELYFNGGAAFQLATGEYLGESGTEHVLTEDALYLYRNGMIRAFDPSTSQVEMVETTDRRGRAIRKAEWTIDERWSFETESKEAECLIRSGNRLYAASPGRIWSLDLPDTNESAPELGWEVELPGRPVRLLAADDRLFAVTLEGSLYCFGADAIDPRAYRQQFASEEADPEWSIEADQILEQTGIRDGYCVAWGIGSGQLIRQLVVQSSLHVIAIDPDPQKVAAARQRWIQEGLYGTRVVVHQGTPATFPLPPYLCNLMVSEDLDAAGARADDAFAKQLVRCLRPYGGAASLPVPARQRKAFAESLRTLSEGEQGLVIRSEPESTSLLVWRQGALPGAGSWTHEHADAANTRVSQDERVRLPLGLLWFGGSSNHAILPRHGHGPQPQVLDGRLIIEGVDLLRAVDIYTGRVLWETDLPGVGDFFNNTAHQPGANASGTNYITTSDGIYILYERSALRLDPATGEKLAEITVPADLKNRDAKETPPARWGYINVVGEFLIAGVNPLVLQFDENSPPKRGEGESLSASKRLVVMDRHTGAVRWSVDAKNHFRHNAICVGGGRLYAIDHLSQGQLARLRRRGVEPEGSSRLIALDLSTGEELWSTNADVFGTWLSYSVEQDVLVEAGRTARDTLNDEPKGMRAYRGSDGEMLWYEASYTGPAMIHGTDRILMEGSGCELLTGKPLTRTDPLTLRQVPWTWSRNYGCNTPMASQCLLTFRSGAAGYFDLLNDGGTGNFGGFRSSCTNNLIVAGGVLCAPDYTRTCTCSYQNQTSVGLVHMRDVEVWTEFPVDAEAPGLKRFALNLGAPGDRRALDGHLWLNEFARAKVTHDERFGFFNGHSSKIHPSEGSLPWVAASGCRGIEVLELDLQRADPSNTPTLCTVRLHFSDPDNDEPGKRTFDVSIQGRKVLSRFDLVKESGGRNAPLVKEFKEVPLMDKVVVRFRSNDNDDVTESSAPVLCGFELMTQSPVKTVRSDSGSSSSGPRPSLPTAH